MKPSPSLLKALELTETQLLTLLIRPDVKPPGGTDKRRHVRSPLHFGEEAVLEYVNQPTPLDRAMVVPRDISVGGLGFLHIGPLPKDKPVALHLPAAGGRTVPLRGRVARCFRLTDRIFGIGVELEESADVELILRRV
ncbi:MAG TPA: PilZ domain-containing protein [Defluviicoccus sp.]|nr:PilZ domain-containing protein [Defluviicoccus sp.]